MHGHTLAIHMDMYGHVGPYRAAWGNLPAPLHEAIIQHRRMTLSSSTAAWGYLPAPPHDDMATHGHAWPYASHTYGHVWPCRAIQSRMRQSSSTATWGYHPAPPHDAIFQHRRAMTTSWFYIKLQNRSAWRRSGGDPRTPLPPTHPSLPPTQPFSYLNEKKSTILLK